MQVRGLVHVHVAFLTVSKELYDVVIFCPVVCAYHSHALVAKNAHFSVRTSVLASHPDGTVQTAGLWELGEACCLDHERCSRKHS